MFSLALCLTVRVPSLNIFFGTSSSSDSSSELAIFFWQPFSTIFEFNPSPEKKELS